MEFVSGGSNNYKYKTNKGNETCKEREFTLNFTNSQLINFESVKVMVIDLTKNLPLPIPILMKCVVIKEKENCLIREEEKNYQMVYTKRRRLANYDTEPYGY